MLEQAAAEVTPPEAVHPSTGSIRHRQHRLDDALREFDAGLAVKPDDPKLLVNRGIILTEMQRPGDAIPTLERVIALGGGNDATVLIIAHRTLANALRQAGRDEEAGRQMREADAVGGARR